MKHLIALLLAFATLFGVGKCGGPQKEGFLKTLDGTTWYIDLYVTVEQYPNVPEKYIGEPRLYYEFAFNTAKRFAFRSSYYTTNGVKHSYEYPGYEETTVSYTLDGNTLTIIPQKEGDEAGTFTITSPTTLTHSSGMRYLKK